MNAFVRFCVFTAYKIYYNFNIEGKDNIPQDKPMIIASNHRSYADPVVLTMPMKLPVAYMAKKELFENKVFGRFIKMLGAFPVERGKSGSKAVEASAALIEAGRHVVIFPEGTRSKDGKVKDAKSGVAVLASMTGADILPCGIVFKGEKLKFRSKLTVRFGVPIKTEKSDVSDRNSDQIKALKIQVTDAIRELAENGA